MRCARQRPRPSGRLGWLKPAQPKSLKSLRTLCPCPPSLRRRGFQPVTSHPCPYTKDQTVPRRPCKLAATSRSGASTAARTILVNPATAIVGRNAARRGTPEYRPIARRGGGGLSPAGVELRTPGIAHLSTRRCRGLF